MTEKPEIYAIDFGTSNSLLAAAHQTGIVTSVPMDEAGNKILKSILYATDPNSWFFGDEAINQYIQDPSHGRVFKSIKRFLPDPSFTRTRVFQDTLALPDLLAKFIKAMRQRANTYFNRDITQVVMGCPARFSDKQEEHDLALTRLEAATQLAGFKTIHFLPEPIAAAYRFQPTLTSEKLVLIADFGGGTSDFTVQKMSQKPFKPDDVLAIHGVSTAGDKYDGVLMEHAISPHFGSRVRYKKPTATKDSTFPKSFVRKLSSPADLVLMSKRAAVEDLREVQRWVVNEEDKEKLENLLLLIEDRMAYSLFREIESTKVALSDENKVPFEWQYVDIDVRESIKRQQFEEHSKAITAEIMKSLDLCLEKAQISASQIDTVCITGGTSKIPAIHEQLTARFGDRLATTSRFDSVVQGLAARAQQLL